jgi:excisionase family DNA binding protein
MADSGQNSVLTKDFLSTGELAQICHVTKHTIITAIANNEIRASRTPGGHNRILRKDALTFMRKYNLIPENSNEGILVVSGESLIFDILGEVCGDGEYALHRAEDLFTAGMMTERLTPALLILDASVPGFSGEAVRRMQQNRPQAIRELVIVAGPEVCRNLNGFRDEFPEIDILEKPFEIEALRNCIAERMGASVSAGNG